MRSVGGAHARTAAGPAHALARLTHFAWLVPTLVLVLGVIDFAVADNVAVSLTNWNGVSPERTWVGSDNFVALATDPVLHRALVNTAVFTAGVISLQLSAGLALAVVVRARVVGAGLLRTLMFVPVVLSPAIVAVTSRQLLSPGGPLATALGPLGMTDFAPLADPRTALATLILLNAWQYTGYAFVIYDAAISQIDPAILEAAQIDGAGGWQTIRQIVLPSLKGAHAVLGVLTAINALKTFDLIYLATAGGPAGATEVVALYIYEMSITRFRAGYAAAIAIILLVLALGLAVAQLALTRSDRRR